MATILALDISSVSTGYVVFRNGRMLKSSLGMIKMKQKLHGERLSYFHNELEKILDKYKPEHVLIENVWKGRNTKTTIVLSWYHGVAHKLVFEHLKKGAWVITAAAVRKLVGNKYDINLLPGKKEILKTGVNGKELTFNFIKNKYALTGYTFKKNNDETDAIALGLAGHILTKDATARNEYFGPPIKKAKRRKKK